MLPSVPPPNDESAAARRSYLRACRWGALAAFPLFLWMLAIGRLDLLHSGPLDSFFDSQTRALFDGHWDIPRGELGFEAFIVDDKAYTYFGLWPSALRMPIFAVTDAYDGRLTQLSILAAFVVFMAATARLGWRVRQCAYGDEMPSRVEKIAAGMFTFILGAGSVVLFLGSRPVVYHEAELWGAAWSIAAFASIVAYAREPNRADLVRAGTTTALALLSRGSVGLAPLVALGCLVLVHAVRLLRDFANRDERKIVGGLLLATAVPFLLYAAVNVARFDHPWRLPIEDQVATQIDPIRPAIFEGTNGSLFAPKFVPTNTLAMFRPDAIAVDGLFPFITFPERAEEVGDITFATFDPAASLPVSMPLLFLLAIYGAIVVFGRRSAYAPTRVLVLGGIVGALGVMTIPFVNQRYQSDFLPLLVVLGTVGVTAGVHRFAESRARWWLVALVAFLGVWSVCVNFALALQYQRAYSPFPTETERAAYLGFQDDLDDALPGGSRATIERGDALPDPASGGTFFVLGECDGVYWSDGASWTAVERTNRTGRYDFELSPTDARPGTKNVLLRAGANDVEDLLWLEHLGENRVRFVLEASRAAEPLVSDAIELPADVTVTFDNRLGRFGVTVNGEDLVGLAYLLAPDPVVVADGEPGIRLVSTPPDFCHDLSDS